MSALTSRVSGGCVAAAGSVTSTPRRSAVSAEVRARIQSLAIPPAWRDVWICLYEDGHLLAIGEDERGRRQYRYHDDWRAFRDLLNFYRLVDFGPRLPKVRAEVERQLRRRGMDRDQVLAAMLRIVDTCGLRVGSEAYAEENESYGLTTLAKKHVRVGTGTVEFNFPAKSGKQAHVTCTIARLRGSSAGCSSSAASDCSRWTAPDRRGRGERPVERADRSSRDSEGLPHVARHPGRVPSLRKHLPPTDAAEQRILNAVDAAATS